MQYFTSSSREDISVPAAVAATWFKVPEGMSVYPFVNPTDDVTRPIIIAKKLYSKRDGGLYLNLPAKTDKKLFKKAIRDNSFSVKAELGICQLTGKYVDIKKLKWRRIYNKKLFCILPVNLGFIWLQDKNQWVRKDDTRIALFTYAGESLKYASSLDWILNSNRTTRSPLENDRIILVTESVAIRLADGSTTRISTLERSAEEYNSYFHCTSCDNHCVDALRVSDTLCSTCAARSESNSGSRIFNYSHKVERDLGFDDKDCIRINESKKEDGKKTIQAASVYKGDPVYLGLELEYSVPSNKQVETVSYIHSTRYAQCKSDSSIPNGYEVVSKPCSISTHRKHLTDILGTYSAYLNPHVNCGLHVHVSRVFTDGEIGKVIYFLNREANRSFIVGLARRDNNSFAKFSDKAISNTKRRMNKSHTFMSEDRRTALNVKDSTLEFRIFATSNDITTVMAAIQFCEAIFMYAHEVKSLSLLEWSNVKNFVDYIHRVEYKGDLVEGKGHTKHLRYPELISYIKTNNLTTVSKDMHEVKMDKILKTFDSRLIPIPRHMEIPADVKYQLANQLAKESSMMLKWLDNSSNIVMWHEDHWGLLDYKGAVLMKHKAA